MEFIIGLIIFCVAIFACGLIASCILIPIAVLIAFFASKRDNRTQNCVGATLSAMSFCFSICICFVISHFVVCEGVADVGFGDFKYVKLSSDYGMEQIDGGTYYLVKENDWLISVDKAVEKDNVLYGRSEDGKFFAVDYTKVYTNEESMAADSINAEYACADDFYRSKYNEVTSDGYGIAFVVCVIVGICSAIAAFFISRILLDFTQSLAKHLTNTALFRKVLGTHLD